jgi:hypothetical protein
MSARNAVKTGKLAASAGTGIPACAIIASSAVVFSVTVLPPVFGPLMISCRAIRCQLQRKRNDVLGRRRLSAGAFRAADAARH